MVVDAITNAIKVVFLSILACLLLPVYPCFIAKFTAEKAADERKAEGLMEPIVGLAPTKPEERRRLSITPSMLEEGHSNGHANGVNNDITNNAARSSTESPNRAARLLSKLPFAKPPRVASLSPFFSFAPSPAPPAAGPPHLKSQQSLFFTRLPLEIRLAIYHHALSCHRVHLVRVPGKVASVACAEGIETGYTCFKGGREDYACLPTHFHHPMLGYGPISFGNLPKEMEAAPVAFADGTKRGIVGALDLLSVCRQLYAEAITVLYKRLTFQMDLITLLAFSISIPEHHLKAITKLEISGPRLNYVDSCYYLQYLPSFRQIRRPSSSSPSSSPPRRSHSSSAASSTTQQANNANAKPQTLYKINRNLTSFTRYRAQDIPVYTPRAPTAWEETCARLLPRLTGLCELRISLKRPWPFSERCMSPASERYLLRPLAEAGAGARLPLLRVFEVRVDWEEGVEGHGWDEKGVWPVLPGRGEDGGGRRRRWICGGPVRFCWRGGVGRLCLGGRGGRCGGMSGGSRIW